MPDLAGGLEDTLRMYVEEALSLRYSVEAAKPGDSPQMFLEALMDIRQRLDRIEEIFAGVLRLRGKARRTADHAKAVAEDVFDQATHQARQDPIREDYVSAKERTAEANLVALTERRAARQAATLADHCDEAVDVLRLTYRGLDGARTDLLSAMRMFQFESSLER